jgi:hypothetical protein
VATWICYNGGSIGQEDLLGRLLELGDLLGLGLIFPIQLMRRFKDFWSLSSLLFHL